MGTRIEYDMRVQLYEHIEYLPVDYFDENESGEIMNRIVGDLRDITEFSHHGPEDIIISVLTMVGTFVILLPINMTLSFFMIGLILFNMFMISTSRKKMKAKFRKNKINMVKLNSSISNSVQGIREAKSFANEKYEIEKFKKYSQEYKEGYRQSYKVMASHSSRTTGSLYFMSTSITLFGAFFVYLGHISIADLAAFTLYAQFANQPIFKMTQFLQQYQQTRQRGHR